MKESFEKPENRSALDSIIQEYDYILLIDVKKKIITECIGPGYTRRNIQTNNDYFYSLNKLLNYEFHPENYEVLSEKITLNNVIKKLSINPIYDIKYETESDSLDIHVKLLRYRYYDENKDYITLYCKDITEIAANHAFEKHKLTTALNETMRANDAKSEFLSRMSHDMRTPLNGIIGLTDLALKENDVHTIKKYLEDVNMSGKFLLGLINDVLDMSKIENKKMELRLESYTLSEFIEYIQAVISPQCIAKKQTFVLNIAKDIPEVIVCDKLRINQIFINLLNNANKYTNEGGTISLSIRQYYAGRTNKVGLQFEVADNGNGMKKEFLERIYEPFNREERGATATTQGTGLGLTIVQSLVDLMQGTIKIDSKIDVGTRVLVHLVFNIPKIDDSITSDVVTVLNGKVNPCIINVKENNTKLSLLNGKRVLIVEDNDVNLLIEVKLLQKINLDIEIAKNGQKALEMFMENEPNYYNAILMDIRMPVMDGITATKAIRSLTRKDAQLIPIIAITANAFKDDIRDCVQAGMDEHISKPIDPKDMYDKLYKVIIEDEKYHK